MHILLQVIHALAVAIFLGNISMTLLWKTNAERTKDVHIIRHALGTALYFDRLITVPAAGVITISGFLLTVRSPFLWSQKWLLLSVGLWFMSAAVAIGYLIPSLRHLQRMVEQTETCDLLPPGYHHASGQWNLISSLLILTPIVIMVIAILKPSF